MIDVMHSLVSTVAMTRFKDGLLDFLATPPAPLSPRQRRALLIVAATIALTRLLAVAQTPWEWDEMLFALALRDYDVASHHPHPPGFPLFILPAKLVALVTPTPFRALQSVSVAASLFVFPALFFLARELRFPLRPALVASALCSVFPNVWLFGGTAFSDVPSLVLVSVAVGFLLRGCRSGTALTTGAMFLGLAAGIRPQSLIVGMIPALLATTCHLRNRNFRRLGVSIAAGAVLVVLAYGGAAWVTGFERYSLAVEGHRAYILREDSFLDPDRSPIPSVFADLFLRQYAFLSLGHLVSLFVLIGIGRAVRRRERAPLLAAATFFPFFIFAVLLLDRFSMSRFAIGYAPMFALLAAGGIESAAAWLARGRLASTRVATALAIGVIAGFFVWMWKPLETVRTTAAPTTAAFEWIASLRPADVGVLYVDSTLQPFRDYFAPDLATTVVIDADAWTLDGEPGILVSQGTPPEPIREFVRPQNRLRKITRSHYYHVAAAPLERTVHFLEGWSGPRREGVWVFRTLQGDGTIVLPGETGERHLKLQLAVSLPEEIRIEWNGAPLFEGVLAPGRHLLHWPLDSGRQKQSNVLRLRGRASDGVEAIRLLALSWGSHPR